MDKVRLGIIGLGAMGSAHAAQISADKIPHCELTAVCDTDENRLKASLAPHHFNDVEALLASGEVDAVLIATPHYAHTSVGIAAFERGLHVLVEKPISVHKADCERLIAAAARHPECVFAAMFNQRTDPRYRKLRSLVQGGELGAIRRIQWTVTDWFRSEAYYASGGWRASWAGEGGGVLLNQCPHNLDLWQWIFGMPASIRAFCGLGRYHAIEVEDDVTAYMRYADGTTGVFITSTGEAPGTNRLEVAAERGRVVVEGGKIGYLRNEMPISEFSATTNQGFARPEMWEINIPFNGAGGQHNEILENFVASILNGVPLIAPAAEGIHSVELANAMIYSSFQNEDVKLPLNPAAYEAKLKELAAASKYVKPPVRASVTAADFSKSFNH